MGGVLWESPKVPIFINKSTDTLTVQGEGWHPILLVRRGGSGHPVLYMCTCMVMALSEEQLDADLGQQLLLKVG